MRLAITATPETAGFGPLLFRGDPAAAFALAEEIGCEGVELHLRRAEDVDGSAVARMVERTGLGVPTIGTGMMAGMDHLTFSDPDPAMRRLALERVQGHIDLAARLRAAVTIGLARGLLGSEPRQRAERQAFFEQTLAECCDLAARAGVTILLEPLNRYECDFLFTVDETTALIRRLGIANLKVLADTFHMNIEETDVATSLRRAGDMLGHVHFVDSNREAPGHGHLDLAAALRTLQEMRYGGYLAFECLPLPDGPAAARDAVTHVRSIKV